MCGDERVLVEEVVDTVRGILQPSSLDYISLSGSDRQLWATAHQYPLNPGANRLILIRDAEKVSRWDPLTGWLGNTRQLPGVYLLFVSNEPDLPYVTGKTLAPHVDALKAPRGSVVRCVMPNEQDATAWILRRAPYLDQPTAAYLLTRTGGHLATIAGVLSKLDLFRTKVGRLTIDNLCVAAPADSFADCLLSLCKKDALACIGKLSDSDGGRVIGLLDSRLDILAVLFKAQVAGKTLREITGVNPYLARQYLPIARHYDVKRCMYDRRVLAVIDDAFRSGAREAIWEALVALW